MLEGHLKSKGFTFVNQSRDDGYFEFAFVQLSRKSYKGRWRQGPLTGFSASQRLAIVDNWWLSTRFWDFGFMKSIAIVLTSLATPDRLMHLKTERASQIRGLPGILASAFAVIIGCIALTTSIPSLGRQAEYGFILSPAAGGFLFILLGLVGCPWCIPGYGKPKGCSGIDDLWRASGSIRPCGSSHFWGMESFYPADNHRGNNCCCNSNKKKRYTFAFCGSCWISHRSIGHNHLALWLEDLGDPWGSFCVQWPPLFRQAILGSPATAQQRERKKKAPRPFSL